MSPAAAQSVANPVPIGRFVGTPYRRFQPSDPYDAIVIGSGIGGLTAAALLAKFAGRRVLVLERHYTAGGFTHVFHRPGFEWDVGVHYVGQVHQRASQIAAMFDYLTEGRLAWNPMPDAYDRVDIDGFRFDYVAGAARLRDALAAAFPRETRTIDRYFAIGRSVLRRTPFFFIEKVLPPWPAAAIGAALRYPFLALARRTTADVLADIGASRELAAVLTAQWVDYGLPPAQSSFVIHALVQQHYFDGAAYPVGGASRIAAAILPVIERGGGAVVVDAEVREVLVEGGAATGVRMTDGRDIRAKAVVSDVGIGPTLALLPPAAAADVRGLAECVQRIPPSAAHLCLYVGATNTAFTRQPDPANRFIHPTIDFDRNWNAFASSLDAPFPCVYISFPSGKDPTFAARYPGHTTIEVVVPAPYDPFARWNGSRWKHRGREYVETKQRLADRLLEVVRTHVPELTGKIATSELSTPLSTEHFVNSTRGASYGLAHTPGRFEWRELRPRTRIRGLFLTGQDTGTLGVSGALSAGIVTVSAMLGRNVFGTVTKPHQRQG
jgi:all-trans-retinol 13,14-reductase